MIVVLCSVYVVIGRLHSFPTRRSSDLPRAKKVIELAVDEARRFNHHYIGTEHILLGLVREGEGIAAGVLESLGVNLDMVRIERKSALRKESDVIAEEDGLPTITKKEMS